MSASRRAPLLAGVASLIAAGCAVAATPVQIQTAGIYSPGIVTIAGPMNAQVYSSAVEFTSLVGASTTPVTLYAFCVDLYHDIAVGFDTQHDVVAGAGDAQAGANLAYHTAQLTVDSSTGPSGQGGTALSTAQIGEIGALAGIGGNLIKTDAADLANKLAGIQEAIWSVEYPTAEGYSFTANQSAVQDYMSGYVDQVVKLNALGLNSPHVTAIYANNGATQGFVAGGNNQGGFGAGIAVPEPAAWALMLVGLGGLGANLRRRRTAPLAA